VGIQCINRSQAHEFGNTVDAQFLFWEYLFPIVGTGALQCVVTYPAQIYTVLLQAHM
jgi:hypothetical protein